MMITPNIPYIAKGRKPAKAEPTPAGPPVLVSATYQQADFVTLAFDRAIEVASLDGWMIAVNDPNSGFLYHATGEADLLSPTTIRIGMLDEEPLAGAQLILSAVNGNGIKSMSGEEWEGIETELPYP